MQSADFFCLLTVHLEVCCITGRYFHCAIVLLFKQKSSYICGAFDFAGFFFPRESLPHPALNSSKPVYFIRLCFCCGFLLLSVYTSQ